MNVKIITLSFNTVSREFDDAEFSEFIVNKEILSVSEHFFIKNDSPYLTLIIKHLHSEKSMIPESKNRPKVDESWKEQLKESDLGIFNILREWRFKRSKKDGLPPYVLFTNKQLAQIVLTKPQSLTELASVDGVGKAKVEKYGQDILEITKVNISNPQEESSASAEDR